MCAAVVLVGVVAPRSAHAQATRVPLGSAADFAVLGASTVTNTGLTVLNGDLGLSPGTSATGFPPGVVNGEIHVGDSVAAQAQADLAIAYDDAAGRTITATISEVLGSTTQTPGVYDSAAGTFGIDGTLTLDAQGDPNAVFIFITVTTLITAANSVVTLVNGARAANVYWVVGSSATLGAGSALQGTVLALTSITATAGATVDGHLLAREGAVTLDTNTVSVTIRPALLSITGPATADLGTAVPGDTISGQLGTVTVDSEEIASWTASVTTAGFITDGGGAPIPASSVSYWSGPITSQLGVGVPIPGQPTAAEALDLSVPRTAFTLQSAAEVTAITWNPTLIVLVPLSAVEGTYTATITHSVA